MSQSQRKQVSQTVLTTLRDKILAHYGNTGAVQSNLQIASDLGWSESTVHHGFNHLADQNLLPPAIVQLKRRNRVRRVGPRVRYERKGPGPRYELCKPETTEAIYQLLRHDPEARALWGLLMAGKSGYVRPRVPARPEGGKP